jgi:DNA polymerase-1
MFEEKQKTLVLIDGHALVHRAYHALPPLNTGKGELVNAVYGFVLVLLKVLKELKPDYLVATFDLAGPTFRHKEFQDYKATRVKAPDELYAQLGRVKETLRAFSVPILEKEGYEADDVIGTVVEKLRTHKEKVNTIIVTGDLDTLQLVDKNTSVFTLKKGVKDTILYDAKAVSDRYGLKPEQIADFKGLKGDPSDNIPGVPGVGDKTAAELLKKYGNIENLYKEIEKSKIKNQNSKLQFKSQKLFEKLLENKEQAIFSKYLATIKRDAPIKFNLRDALAHDYDKDKVTKLFKELGFYSLVERLPASSKRGEPGTENSEQKETMESEQSKLPDVGKPDATYEKIEQAKAQGVLSEKIYQIEKKLVPILRQMESNGIKIDIEYLKKVGQKVSKKIIELEKNIHKVAGAAFNINSPQQLSEVLFGKLGIQTKGLKKTPGKVISTAAPELEKLKDEHEIIGLISDYRELTKLKSTYIDALPKLVAPDGRLHTSYDQLGTTTGRLSSKNPNLQNIPIKTELGREIRKAFVAEEGFKLLSADYSQIELRVVAAIARDKNMIGAFGAGQDIHILTAAETFGVKPEDVSPAMRQAAKVLNFGVIYGMSIHGFAQAAGVDFEKAKLFIDKYFKEFDGVARYIEETKKDAAKNGYVQTLFGRKRFIPEINSSAWNLRAAAERMAINMPVQGTAADLIKMAMVNLAASHLLKADCRLLLQVHDELVFEVSEKEAGPKGTLIKEIIENVYKLEVPLKVEMEIGDNWGEMEKLAI